MKRLFKLALVLVIIAIGWSVYRISTHSVQSPVGATNSPAPGR